MKKKNKFLDILKIASVEILILFLTMLFFRIESVWILFAALALIGGTLLYTRIYKKQSGSIKALFTSNRPTVLIILVLLLLLYPIVSPIIIPQSTYWTLILIQTGIYIMVALGLNMQLGSTGMMNLAAAAFYGVGAYTAGMLALKLNWPALITIPVAGIVTALVSLVLFLPVYKTKGHYLALVTLAFGYMLALAADNIEFIGGPQGLKNIPSINLLGYDFLSKVGNLHFYTNYYYLVLVLVILTIVIFHRFFNSWIGLTLSYIRDDEPAAKGCGVNSNRWKLLSLTTGCFFMGVAGAIYAHMIGFISPPNFQFTQSLLIVSIVIIGGMDNILGVIVGAIILVIIPEKFRVITEYRVMLYGILIVVTLLFRPRGLMPFGARKYDASLLSARNEKEVPDGKK